MSKESLHNIDHRVVFKETFQSEQNTRRLGSVPTDVGYNQGKGSFNRTTSWINYPKQFNGVYSVRIKCKPIDFIAYNYLFDSRGSNNDGAGYCLLDITTGEIIKSSGTAYINGNLGTIFSANEDIEIIISGITIITGTGTNKNMIGSGKTNNSIFLGLFELVEIYKRILTPEEISNLYSNKTYHELPDVIDENTYKILDVAAFGGVLEDKMGNILIPTDIEIKKIGSNIWSPDLNGATSKIDAGNFDSLVGDLTILAWVNPKTFGVSTLGYILSNGKLTFYINASNSRLNLTNTGGAAVASASNSINLNKWQFVVSKRTSAGLVTFYVDGIISGAENQDGGTPVVGTTNILIGDRVAGSREFDGKISRETIYKGILSTEQITQFYTNTKRYFK